MTTERFGVVLAAVGALMTVVALLNAQWLAAVVGLVAVGIGLVVARS